MQSGCPVQPQQQQGQPMTEKDASNEVLQEDANSQTDGNQKDMEDKAEQENAQTNDETPIKSNIKDHE